MLAPRYARQSGFSLLEVMIAFAILAFLFTGLFASFNTMSKGWDAADNRMSKTEDMRLISDFLRRQLSQMIVVRVMGTEKGGTKAPVFAFKGEGEVVRYAAPLQPLQGQGGIYLIELTFKGQKLQMRYAPYRPDTEWDEAFNDSEPVLVYEGLKKAKFSYFAAETMEEDPEWLDEWETDKGVYPLLLKLSLADNERQWPDLLVQLPQVDAYVAARR
ncbi:prepilin-type N-terminal cleavage/methylation domain-containing protein [Thiofilum flexile]|uniref:prepilin-type N-terminal cleavage/methylation domain-containing protein n=1 Tax=Thiofilum flexile TaxID=125627 RepID=UPI00037DA039|nr:prepilin-type N-terminal cleavage/methylation domain-containing protein [Thiofilum flexile]